MKQVKVTYDKTKIKRSQNSYPLDDSDYQERLDEIGESISNVLIEKVNGYWKILPETSSETKEKQG